MVWKKILYENQGVPDNYVDDTFLDELKKNLYIRTYSFWPVVIASGAVTQQICSVCLFVVMFMYMDEGDLHPHWLFVASSLFTLFGYFLHFLLTRMAGITSNRTLYDDLRTCVLFVTSGFALSPLLMTLTETISTDTLYVMTFFMLLANLLFHDYGTDAAMVSQSLSLNAAIFASVCLASRLPTALHTFTTVTCAVQVFALWPVLRTSIKNRSAWGQVGLTLSLSLVSCLAIFSISTVGAALFVLMLLFITFVCPAWLIRMQPYKNNIYGPWDEAVIQE